MRSSRSSMVLALSILVACGGDPDPRTDADAAVRSDGAIDESCEEIAASITCSDADRQCSHRAFGAYCASDRTDVLREDLRCIRTYSDASCRSFGDPSAARDCIEQVHDAAGYASAMPLAMAWATACGEPSRATTLIHTATPPLATLSEASIAALLPCIEAATTCEAAQTCMAERYPEPYACFL